MRFRVLLVGMLGAAGLVLMPASSSTAGPAQVSGTLTNVRGDTTLCAVKVKASGLTPGPGSLVWFVFTGVKDNSNYEVRTTNAVPVNSRGIAQYSGTLEHDYFYKQWAPMVAVASNGNVGGGGLLTSSFVLTNRCS